MHLSSNSTKNTSKFQLLQSMFQIKSYIKTFIYPLILFPFFVFSYDDQADWKVCSTVVLEIE
jgi:hypothetical protein